MKRYFTEQPVTASFEITGGEYNHMANVMRARAGERVVVCNGDGTDYLCEIERIDKKSARLCLLSREPNGREAEADVTAFLGLLKGDNTELEVQKLSELGLRRAVPFYSEHTVARADEKKIERFNRVAVESAKQCGRAYCLKVEPAIPFREIFSRSFDRLLFCYEAEERRGIAEALADLPRSARVAFVVGSEGGFTPEEADFAREHGGMAVSLGRRILRAETAAIAAGALTMFALGEMGAK